MKTRIQVLLGALCLLLLACDNEDISIDEDLITKSESAPTVTMILPEPNSIYVFGWGGAWPLTQAMTMQAEMEDEDGLSTITFMVKNDNDEVVHNKTVDLSYWDAEEYTQADMFSPDVAGDYTVMVTVQDELGNETSSDPIQITYK
ncbi:hypothetical protein [Roseivirga sp.]|uniref:hypothetical protein n=1 Tax=Roseivirga sp. TaxID=1964215 RepID=UPI003B52750D